MIAGDQPTCFSSDVRVVVSSRSDGTMLDRTKGGMHAPNAIAHRQAFCGQVGIDYSTLAYQIIEYGAEYTYDVIEIVGQPNPEGIYADALYTEMPGVSLFLPVADCVATVVYDTKHRALALAHLGRHSSIAKLLPKLIDYMQARGTNPEDIVMWMAPSAHQESYRMEYFDQANDPDWQGYVDIRDEGTYLDLSGYNANLAMQAGVPQGAISISPVDTMRSEEYFSHAAGDTSGRFAVLAQILKR